MIRVDTFTTMLSKPVQKIITIVCTVIVGAFTVLLVKGGFDLIAVTAKTGQRSPVFTDSSSKLLLDYDHLLCTGCTQSSSGSIS